MTSNDAGLYNFTWKARQMEHVCCPVANTVHYTVYMQYMFKQIRIWQACVVRTLSVNQNVYTCGAVAAAAAAGNLMHDIHV